MSRLSFSEQRQRNAEALHKFYSEVLEAFIHRLEKEFRYKSKVSEEQIEEMQKLIREKINLKNRKASPFEHFTSYLKMKQSSIVEELKVELEADSTFSRDRTEPTTEIAVKLEQTLKSQPKNEVEEQDFEDDLLHFVNNLNFIKTESLWCQNKSHDNLHGSELKKDEKKQVQQDKKDQKKQKKQQNSSESEQDEDPTFLQRVNEKIGTAMVGTFSSFQIKRKPKQQKIFIDLENVFIKFAHSPYENFYSRVNCQLSKIEKEDIREMKM